VVTATCLAPGSGDVFLGYEDGSLMGFCPGWWLKSRPLRGPGEAIRLPGGDSNRVTSLATALNGHLVVALRDGSHAPHELTSYLLTPQGDYRVASKLDWGHGDCYLATIATGSRHHLVGLAAEQKLTFLRGARLIHSGRLAPPEDDASWCSTLMFPSPQCSPLSMIILLFGHNSVWYCCAGPEPEGRRWTAPAWHRTSLGWTPGVPPENPLRYPFVSWLQQGAEPLELAGVDNSGTIHWSQADMGPEHFTVVSTQAVVRAEGYLAAAIVRPGLIAGVSRSHIDWLRGRQTSITPEATMRAALPHAVACFPCSLTEELIVVCQDGVVARVPVPK